MHSSARWLPGAAARKASRASSAAGSRAPLAASAADGVRPGRGLLRLEQLHQRRDRRRAGLGQRVGDKGTEGIENRPLPARKRRAQLGRQLRRQRAASGGEGLQRGLAHQRRVVVEQAGQYGGRLAPAQRPQPARPSSGPPRKDRRSSPAASCNPPLEERIGRLPPQGRFPVEQADDLLLARVAPGKEEQHIAALHGFEEFFPVGLRQALRNRRDAERLGEPLSLARRRPDLAEELGEL